MTQYPSSLGIDPAERKGGLSARPRFDLREVDGILLKLLANAGLSWLSANQQTVNALNVFPVPDGDTGTNMVLTMQAACREIANGHERNIGKVAHAIAQGALMGARGNSGVILSQLWRGFSRSLDQRPRMNSSDIVSALKAARDTAYQGVVRPVEGTILTVASDAAQAADEAQAKNSTPLQMLEQVVEAADRSVQRTPELLYVLREAGVVDSGGKGLFFILEGMLRVMRGESVDQPSTTVQPLSAVQILEAEELVEPGQDYEVVVDFRPDRPLDLETFYSDLQKMGTSIQVGQGEDLYRMHIHVPTEKRYRPVDYIMKLGSVSKVSIENLLEQTALSNRKQSKGNYRLAAVAPGQLASVVVAPGEGLARVFASLGAAAIVPGGQTMNPSTQEILKAFEDLPSDQIILLPNNKNVHMTAQQAKELTVKRVMIVPSGTVPEGIAAMLAFCAEGRLEIVAQAMTQALSNVQTGEITVATRDVELNGLQVKEGQMIGLLNGELAVSGETLQETLERLLEHGRAQSCELIALYWGSDLTASEAKTIEEKIRSKYPTQEIELIEGDQPHYPLILSLE
ncbi:MAG: DAK2 domain-containing protein [Anaerolineales bacterium]